MPDPALQWASSCFFPTTFHKVPLLSVKDYNYDTKIFTFALPEDVALDLPIASCLQMQGFDEEGNEAIRAYTPISSNSVTGSFELLVKVYPKGVVTKWLAGLKPGSLVGFRHRADDIKAQYPFNGKKRINMICGGTGVTPMFQILQHIAEMPEDELEVVLLCGNKRPPDILLRQEIQEVASRATRWDSVDFFTRKTGKIEADSRVQVVHIIGDRSDMPASGPFSIPNWDGEVGWVDEERVQKYCFPPAEDVLTFVCGLPGLYQEMCGPRAEAHLKEGTVLHKLGYTSEMVCKL